MNRLSSACVLLALSAALPAAELSVPDRSTLLSTSPALQAPGTTGILPADQAFPLVAQAETDGSITLFWQLPPRFYLYQKSLALTLTDGAVLQLELPEPTRITDEYFGEVAVYFDRLVAHVATTDLKAGPGATLELLLTYPGCAQDLYCYPLQQKTLTLQLPD